MKKIILEQSNPCFDPATGQAPETVYKAKRIGYTENRPSDFSDAKYCFIMRGGKSLYKSKTGAPRGASRGPQRAQCRGCGGAASARTCTSR